jgi:signal transduction histidine kinase
MLIIFMMVPQMLIGAIHADLLFRLALFSLAGMGWALFNFRWLCKYRSVPASALRLLGSWALATAFTVIFSGDFSNAYLSYVVAVQLMFAFEGLGMGLAMFGLTILADLYHLVWHRDVSLQANLFALSIQVLTGLLTWLFVSRAHSAQQKAEALTRDITRLNQLLLNAQDGERRRLARDIHDGPLQSLGVQLLAVERIKRYLENSDRDKVLDELNALRGSIRSTASELRGTVNTLRNTLLDGGIEPALTGLARRAEEATGLKVNVRVKVERELPEALQSCLYHLAVEAVNNIKKHARACEASILLVSSSAGVQLTIKDDGVGFDYKSSLDRAISRGHIGLHSMKERAGEFGGVMEVTSAPGHGAEVVFRFPSPTPYSQPAEPVFAAEDGDAARAVTVG